jgi:hypothetical protein
VKPPIFLINGCDGRIGCCHRTVNPVPFGDM